MKRLDYWLTLGTFAVAEIAALLGCYLGSVILHNSWLAGQSYVAALGGAVAIAVVASQGGGD